MCYKTLLLQFFKLWISHMNKGKFIFDKLISLMLALDVQLTLTVCYMYVYICITVKHGYSKHFYNKFMLTTIFKVCFIPSILDTLIMH